MHNYEPSEGIQQMLLKKRFVVGLGMLDGQWVPQPEGSVSLPLQFAATTSASVISPSVKSN
jgi:hypothetical protein